MPISRNTIELIVNDWWVASCVDTTSIIPVRLHGSLKAHNALDELYIKDLLDIEALNVVWDRRLNALIWIVQGSVVVNGPTFISKLANCVLNILKTDAWNQTDSLVLRRNESSVFSKHRHILKQYVVNASERNALSQVPLRDRRYVNSLGWSPPIAACDK